jgi:hypothetical protein
MRFLGRIGPEETKLAYGLMIGATWGTTVALFIHTLKFKGYIGARTGWLVVPFVPSMSVTRLHLLHHAVARVIGFD